jgi:hypothetical protein
MKDSTPRLHDHCAPVSIRRPADAPPVEIPSGHIGPVVLPRSGRLVWWTGRVAIGLRHEPARHNDPPGQSALWLQNLMLGKGRGAKAA